MVKHLEQEKFTNPGAIDMSALGEEVFSKSGLLFSEEGRVCVCACVRSLCVAVCICVCPCVCLCVSPCLCVCLGGEVLAWSWAGTLTIASVDKGREGNVSDKDTTCAVSCLAGQVPISPVNISGPGNAR